jgi:hypothetical protein
MLNNILVIVGLVLVAVGIVSIFVLKTGSGKFSTPIFSVTGNAGIIVIAIGVGCLACGAYLNATNFHVQSQATLSPNASPSSVGAVTAQSQSPSPSQSQPPSPSPPVSPQGLATSGYGRYTNARYGFMMLWPTSLKAESPQSDGSGQIWISADGRTTLFAYGANNVLSYSPRQDEVAESQGLRVVYSNISGNVVTVSGYKNNGRTIVYQRDVVGSGAIDTLLWRYPASEKAQWDTAVALSVQTFQAGNVATEH